MKKLLSFLATLLLLSGAAAGYAAEKQMDALLQQFKTTEESAKANVFSAVSGPSFFIPNVKLLKTLSTEERIALINSIGRQVKEYLGSKEFIDRYNRYREERKPKAPDAPKYANQIKDEQRAGLQKSIAEIEKNKAQVPKEQQAMFDEILKGLRQQLVELDDPRNTMFSPDMDKIIKQSHEMQMNEYAGSVAAWENAYPADNPRPMIRRWISSFLEKTASIDYDAKTTAMQGGTIQFADPSYERKDKLWKLCYRAGKESVAAARAFAQDWLGELQ